MSAPAGMSVSVPANPAVTSSGDSTVGAGIPRVIDVSSVVRPRPPEPSFGSSVT